MRIGIISALFEEQEGIVDDIVNKSVVVHGKREYTCGQLWGCEVVCVLSRIGKVAAAMTATILIEKFGVTHVIFTGVAGAGHADVKVGDVVLASQLVQHDIDASPLFPRFEVPLTGRAHFHTDRDLNQHLAAAAASWRVHHGLIASGDQFINDGERIAALRDALPDVLAVEMEGAAVAQVCHELDVPFAVIRTISDNANEEAATDFMLFVRTVAAKVAYEILKTTLTRLARSRNPGP
ncbi:5'-methylthioadenosine/adenosylhomocysteine nucleosidase [Massilia sp. TS11]|uniref:5'-methylthioadenosine/adenosylhomocysteine nucleosidase n=1 Tax=Massilia sp. TS11 TaxID=2908003 RepID=UPI001EDA5061|nr:5'-methylthioadenosine/adenosylhomocysteine nucleosidase [Massilia sp. TS11]MCG2585222.1 5'-methylthioadenosine/adenosylhomocysteine nucleosidase [Massilia sp. TS11]